MTEEEHVISVFAREKKERQTQLLKYIAEYPDQPYDKIVGKFSYEWGLRGNTVRRYLDELNNAGLVEITSPTIFSESVVKITDEGKNTIKNEGVKHDSPRRRER